MPGQPQAAINYQPSAIHFLYMKEPLHQRRSGSSSCLKANPRHKFGHRGGRVELGLAD
jgi:hypothetical protein